MNPSIFHRAGLRLLLIAAVIGLSGCHGDGDDDDGGFGALLSLFVANDQGSDSGSVERLETTTSLNTGLDMLEQTFTIGLAEGIAIDGLGNLYQAGINAANGTLRAACSIQNRANNASFSANRDRVITTGLTGPKGIVEVSGAGVIIAAENGAALNALSVFSATAGPGAGPLFAVTRLALGNTGAWDIAYDEASDRLFAALINGTVAYIPNFLAGGGVSVPVIFQPDNPLGTGSNMHGIAYDASADRLIVSDVAVASGGDFDTDGSLYVFNNASTLTGTVTPDRTLRGAATLLGNPVDLLLSGGNVIVAEKANAGGQLLVFNDIASGAGGDIAPDRAIATTGGQPPEALALRPEPLVIASDGSDLTGGASALFVTSNAGGAGADIFAVDTGLTAVGDRFTPIVGGQNIESIGLDQNGDAVVSLDTGGGANSGGLSFVNRLGTRADLTVFDGDRDRQVTGASVVLDSPKGFDVVGSLGLVIVADVGPSPGQVQVFSLCAGGDVAPLATTTLPAGVAGWDVDYDPANDRLYVAGTNGTVLVYDNYIASSPAAPARTITPDFQSAFPDTNLHGIVHDAASDRLIVSDVGSAGVANDGRIYVIDNASTADGLTALRLEISGPSTNLGNPVDLAFDGQNLYVAEKSNNVLLRYDGILTLSNAAVQDRAPDLSLGFVAPESIALSP